MVLRTRKRATEKMVDLAATPRTKKKAKVVCTALSQCNPTYTSVINNMASPGVLSQDLVTSTAWSRLHRSWNSKFTKDFMFFAADYHTLHNKLNYSYR